MWAAAVFRSARAAPKSPKAQGGCNSEERAAQREVAKLEAGQALGSVVGVARLEAQLVRGRPTVAALGRQPEPGFGGGAVGVTPQLERRPRGGVEAEAPSRLGEVRAEAAT